MPLTMPFTPDDYLFDQSGNTYVTTDSLSAGGWLWENPFAPGQPVALAGLGARIGSPMRTESGIGTGVVGIGTGLGVERGISNFSASGAAVAGPSTGEGEGGGWSDKFEVQMGSGAEVNVNSGHTTAQHTGWPGVGSMDIADATPRLEFRETSSTSTAAQPFFPTPFYGNVNISTTISTTQRTDAFDTALNSQHWEVPGMIPAPVELMDFLNFPSRSIPTGARYDQLLQAKLGGSPRISEASSARGAMGQYASAAHRADTSAMGQNSLHPTHDDRHRASSNTPGPWMGSTAPTSAATTPLALVPSQSTQPIPPSFSQSLPPAHGGGPYSASAPSSISPNVPSTFLQHQQQQHMQYPIPSPLSLSSAMPYYPQVSPPVSRLPDGSLAAGMRPGPILSAISAPDLNQVHWGYEPQQDRLQGSAQTQMPPNFEIGIAGPSRPRAVPQRIQSAPLVSHHSEPSTRTPLGYFGWQQQHQESRSMEPLTPASAPITTHPSSTSQSGQYQHHPQSHQRPHQAFHHYPSQHPHYQPHMQQSYEVQLAGNPNLYPSPYPHFQPSVLPIPMYHSWTPTLPPDLGPSLSLNAGPALIPGPIEPSTNSLDIASQSRSRSASSFVAPPVASSPAAEDLVKREPNDVAEAAPQQAQRKRRKKTADVGKAVPIPKQKSPKKKMKASETGSDEDRKVDIGQSSKQAEEEEDRKVVIACHMCRAKKLKCDGVRPRCHNCERKGEEICAYDERLKRRGQGKKTKEKLGVGVRDVDLAGTVVWRKTRAPIEPENAREAVGANLEQEMI